MKSFHSLLAEAVVEKKPVFINLWPWAWGIDYIRKSFHLRKKFNEHNLSFALVEVIFLISNLICGYI